MSERTYVMNPTTLKRIYVGGKTYQRLVNSGLIDPEEIEPIGTDPNPTVFKKEMSDEVAQVIRENAYKFQTHLTPGQSDMLLKRLLYMKLVRPTKAKPKPAGRGRGRPKGSLNKKTITAMKEKGIELSVVKKTKPKYTVKPAAETSASETEPTSDDDDYDSSDDDDSSSSSSSSSD